MTNKQEYLPKIAMSFFAHFDGQGFRVADTLAERVKEEETK
jgi:hypothetical protein